MNLIPKSLARWLSGQGAGSGAKFREVGGDLRALIRQGDPQGVWSGAMNGFEARKVNPHLYEALREALPILDGAISTTVTLDGIVRVEGDNGKLVSEIEDFISSIPVNDAEKGLQAFYETQGNEKYEQGFGIGEFVLSRNGKDITGLRVADSKGVFFRREDDGLAVYYRPPGEPLKLSGGLDNVEMLLRNGALPQVMGAVGNGLAGMGYTRLDTAQLLYTVNQPEADNPYGTSLLRSLEFGGKTLLTIQNAINNVWTRYGDPVMLAIYKCANPQVLKTEGKLEARQAAIANLIRTAMEAKGSGNSVDIVQAIGKDDDFTLEVIGAEGIALEIEMPARHLLEQIVAKVQIPAFMLGLQFSTSERMAEQQAGMAIQASKTRWERRRPGMEHLVATMLRLRGRTWKPGDWKLTQELPNITDRVKEAQAGFLVAQTGLMLAGTPAAPQQEPKPRGVDNNLRHHHGGASKAAGRGTKAPNHQVGEDWADDDEALPRIERTAVGRLLVLWAIALGAIEKTLKLRDGADAWRYEGDMLAGMLDAEASFLRVATGNDGAVNAALVEIWQRGVDNAAAEAGAEAPLSEFTEAVARALRERGMSQVRTTEVRVLRERIINVIAAGALDGLPAASVAAELQRLFGMGEYDWQMLVSAELVQAYGGAKLAEFEAQGLERYDWTTAGDGDVCSTCAGHRDNGPYEIGKGPVPMRDSHPLCRCAVVPAL